MPTGGCRHEPAVAGWRSSHADDGRHRAFWHSSARVIPVASTTVDLARIQFATTSLYHFLFVPLTLGLAPLVAVMQTIWRRTGDDAWLRLTHFVGPRLLINFALGVAPGPKNRWAWECAFPAPHREDVRADEATSHLPEGLVYAVMRQESGYDPEVVSPARAVGLLQLLPETARAVAAEGGLAHDDTMLTSPPHNISLGARYLHSLLDKFHAQAYEALPYINAGQYSPAVAVRKEIKGADRLFNGLPLMWFLDK